METCLEILLSIRPARAKVCPSASWRLDSAFRLRRAGMRNPERTTALAKSSSLTSWAIFRRISPFGAIFGWKFSRTPNSL